MPINNLAIVGAISAFSPIADDDSVPEGSIAHFDFASDSYWTQADGDLTAAQVVNDPTMIEAGVGFRGRIGEFPTMAGAAVAAFSSSMTVVMRGRLIVPGDASAFNGAGIGVEAADSSDYNSYVAWTVAALHDNGNLSIRPIMSVNDSNSGEQFNGSWKSVALDTEVRIDAAFNITETRGAVSLLGDAVEGEDFTETEIYEGASGHVGLPYVDGAFGEIALESLTVYPLQLEADLPALATPL